MAEKGVALKFSVRVDRARTRIIHRASVACGNLNKPNKEPRRYFSLLFCSVNIQPKGTNPPVLLFFLPLCTFFLTVKWV